MMTNEEFQGLIKDFYAKNKYFYLIDVIAATPGHHQCQVCGNKHLKKLCQIRNEERNEEWFVGWECHSALEELQEREQKKMFAEIVHCSQCGKENRRGELPREAYAAHLCKNCWLVKNGLSVPEPQQWFFESITQGG